MDYEIESKRLQCLNQRFAFIMNAVQVIKIRQAGGEKDLGLDILGKRSEQVLDSMIREELDRNAEKASPLKVL
jgi:hypothetical protein